MTKVIPILRIFDEEKAKDFYLNYLGFQLDWEHRFEESFPLYMQISSGLVIIHLSEHHGDCTPGAAIRIETNQIDQIYTDLSNKNYKYLSPRVEDTPWDMRELELVDPFGNRLIYYEDKEG